MNNISKSKFSFSKFPRGQLYLKLSYLITVFFKIIFVKASSGQKVREFELLFSQYHNSKRALALPHARIAFYYILKSLNLPEGSEVLMTPINIADMVNVVHSLGLKPVFCDLGQHTYNADYDDLEKKITSKTKVLFMVHLNGLVSDMDKIADVVNKHNLALIEDCSQALGAKFNNKLVGTFGLAGIFSLSIFKTCSTLFGGMIISDNDKLIESIKNDSQADPLPQKSYLLSSAVKNIIIAIATNRFIFSILTYYLIKLLSGFDEKLINKFVISNKDISLKDNLDSKMFCAYTDLQAEMGIRAFTRLDRQNMARVNNVNILFKEASAESRSHLPIIIETAQNVYWRLPVAVKDPKYFIKYMFAHYIDTMQTNLALCSQEEAFKMYHMATPGAYRARYQTVFIPIHSSFSGKDMLYLGQRLNNYFKKYV